MSVLENFLKNRKNLFGTEEKEVKDRKAEEKEISDARNEALSMYREEGMAEGLLRGRAEGRADGMAEGFMKGMREGERRMNKLIRCLLAEEKYQELKRASCDEEYRSKLFEHYQL